MTAPTLERLRAMAPANPAIPPTKRTLWQLVAWALVCLGLYDGIALTMGSDRYFSSPSYYAVRALIGLRPAGAMILAATIALAMFLGSPERDPRRLRAALMASFAWHVFWLTALLLSWATVGIAGLTAPGASAFAAACSLFLSYRVDERRGA